MKDEKYYIGRSYMDTTAEFLKIAKKTLELAGESNIEFGTPYQTTGRPGFYGVAYTAKDDGENATD